jgi:hypothetical protein
MKKNIISSDLALSLTLNQTGEYTNLSIGINPTKETVLISANIANRKELSNLLITLTTEDLTREQLLKNFSSIIVDIQINDDLFITKKSDEINDYQWRKFLNSIKDLNLWPLIRETGFHELLPEK